MQFAGLNKARRPPEPGFIDVHSHSDLQVLEGRQEKLLQGVITETVGNCGFPVFPGARDRSSLNEFARGTFCAESGWGWISAKEYLARRIALLLSQRFTLSLATALFGLRR